MSAQRSALMNWNDFQAALTRSENGNGTGNNIGMDNANFGLETGLQPGQNIDGNNSNINMHTGNNSGNTFGHHNGDNNGMIGTGTGNELNNDIGHYIGHNNTGNSIISNIGSVPTNNEMDAGNVNIDMTGKGTDNTGCNIGNAPLNNATLNNATLNNSQLAPLLNPNVQVYIQMQAMLHNFQMRMNYIYAMSMLFDPDHTINTRALATFITNELRRLNITKLTFGRKLLNRSPSGTHLLLSHPTQWKRILGGGKDAYVRMLCWVLQGDEKKRAIMNMDGDAYCAKIGLLPPGPKIVKRGGALKNH